MIDDYYFVKYDELKHVTAKATLYEIQGEDVWIPDSLIASDEGGEVEIPGWFADQAGLINERE